MQNWTILLHGSISERYLCILGLKYLHHEFEKPIRHGDIKSPNILLCQNGDERIAKVSARNYNLWIRLFRTFLSSNLQIADFGLSQELTNTIPEGGGCSHRWAAPEIFLVKDGMSPIKSTKSDVWAMGAVVWELWMEYLPYENRHPGASQTNIIALIMNEETVKTFFC